MNKITLALKQGPAKVVKYLEALPDKYTNNGHKFVYTKNKKLIVSTTGKKNPNHKELGDNNEVVTAGYINVKFNNNSQIKEIYFDNRSAAYNPSYESLKKAKKFIVETLGSVKVKLKNNPNPKS